MVFVKRAGQLVGLFVGLSGCAQSTAPEPTAASELRFSDPIITTDEADPSAKLFVADANDDKWLDVLTWGEGAPYVNVALPDQGLKQPLKLAGVPSGPIRQAAWVDLTGDRCADLLVLNDEGALQRFHSESVDEYSEQTLKLPAIGPLAAFVTLDINRDDRLDFVLLGAASESDAGQAATHVYVLLGEAGNNYALVQDLTFEELGAEASPQTTSFLQPTDANGDGRWDVAVGIPGIGVGMLVQAAHLTEGGIPPVIDAGVDAEAPLVSAPGLFVYQEMSSGDGADDTSAVVFIDHDNDGGRDWLRFSPEADAQLFRNLGDGTFDTETFSRGLAPGALGCVEDFDNDGRLDVLSVADSVVLKLGTSKEGEFKPGVELTPGSSLPVSSLVCVDLDNDGDVDLLTAGRKGTGLYLNRLEPLKASDANFFDFRFVGNEANPSGLGTSIAVVVGKQTTQREFFASGQAFLSASPSLHWGLGDETLFDTVSITWPNGEAVSDSDWTVNDTVTVTQPE